MHPGDIDKAIELTKFSRFAHNQAHRLADQEIGRLTAERDRYKTHLETIQQILKEDYHSVGYRLARIETEIVRALGNG